MSQVRWQVGFVNKSSSGFDVVEWQQLTHLSPLARCLPAGQMPRTKEPPPERARSTQPLTPPVVLTTGLASRAYPPHIRCRASTHARRACMSQSRVLYRRRAKALGKAEVEGPIRGAGPDMGYLMSWLAGLSLQIAETRRPRSHIPQLSPPAVPSSSSS